MQPGSALANSWHVAKVSGRQPKHVLSAINRIDCSNEFNRHDFLPVENEDSDGRTIRSFDMTRDGFTFLVVGFTGSTAARNRAALMRSIALL